MENLNIGSGAGLAALAFWGFIAATVVAGVWDSIRKREAQHETVRRIIESGQTIDNDLLDKLLMLSDGGKRRVDRDLKITGIWLLPIAVGMAVFALILGSAVPGALAPLLGVSGLLACMGIGTLVGARITARWYKTDNDSAG